MTQPLKSQADLYTVFTTALQGAAPQLTDLLPGSVNDALAGVFSVAGNELQRSTVLQFNKTFIDLANGPAITGGDDDLQTLLVDHFGDAFKRPGAIAALDTIAFIRPTNVFGPVTILAGTIVKTQADANGNVQRYATNANVTLTQTNLMTVTVLAANATVGDVYLDALGRAYTVTATIVGGTTLSLNGTGNVGFTAPWAGFPPPLTKQSGAGDAFITVHAIVAPDTIATVGVTAVVAGAAGNAAPGTINAIESTVLDTTLTCKNQGNVTGADAMDDATYREFARNLIQTLRAATKAAIEAAARAVSGVVVATALEVESPVVFWNPATNLPLNPAVAGLYEFFYIPFVTLYIADSLGGASGALIVAVRNAIDPVRAFGVNITIGVAQPVFISWSLAITLNPAGPNYPTFVNDSTAIVQSMRSYIAKLPTATSFVRATAQAAILAIWGPAGTNDLTAVSTTFPVGDVAIIAGQKAIPNIVKTV